MRKTIAAALALAIMATPLAAQQAMAGLERANAPVSGQSELGGNNDLFFVAGIAAVAAAVLLLSEDDQEEPVSAG